MDSREQYQRQAAVFQSDARAFDQYHPGYHAPKVLQACIPEGAQVAVDLGAGTGAWTEQVAALVPTVYAVDPSEDMLSVLARRVPGASRVHGTAEYLRLEDNSVDMVTCANMWAYVEPHAALEEAMRVLRPGGRLSIVWNAEDHHGPSDQIFGKDLPCGDELRGRHFNDLVQIPRTFTELQAHAQNWKWKVEIPDLISWYMVQPPMRLLSARQQRIQREALEAAVANHPDCAEGKLVIPMHTYARIGIVQ